MHGEMKRRQLQLRIFAVSARLRVSEGVLKLENVVYYVAVTFFFLFAATKTLEARRWR